MPEWEVNTAAGPARARILVVEDEPLIRMAFSEELRALGAEVVEAANADQAWEYLTCVAMVDLIFTDHRMPGSMTGAQFAARVRRQYPNLTIIIASGHLDEEWSGPAVKKPYLFEKMASELVELALKSKELG